MTDPAARRSSPAIHLQATSPAERAIRSAARPLADYGSSIALLGGDAFTSNSVTSQSTTQYSAGGAIFITANGSNLVITGSGNAFTGNTVTAGPSETGGNANGGAIDLDSGGFLDMSAATGTTFSQNVASAPDSLGSAFGGAIEYFIPSCKNGCSIARRGGQIAHHSGRPPIAQAALGQRQFHVHGSAKAVARETSLAGAIDEASTEASRSLVRIRSSLRSRRTKRPAVPRLTFGVTGGAIDVEETSSFTIISSSFTGNQVGPTFGYGGAVSSENSTITITGDVFTTNSASNGAGAIALDYTLMTLSTSTLMQNSVTTPSGNGDGGGGIWAGGDGVSTVTQSTIANNTVAGNVAGTGGGGAMIYAGELDFTNDTITGNTSTVDGGGIELAPGGSGYTTLTNVTLYANTATNGTGGNVYLGAGNATITNSIFARGAASNRTGYRKPHRVDRLL